MNLSQVMSAGEEGTSGVGAPRSVCPSAVPTHLSPHLVVRASMLEHEASDLAGTLPHGWHLGVLW